MRLGALLQSALCLGGDMSDGMIAGGVVALFFVGVGASLSYFFKKPSVVSLLANAVLVFFGATFLNAILVFRDDVKLWGLIFIPVFMPFSKILIRSNGDSAGEWRVVGFFCVFVCFMGLVGFRDFLRVSDGYGFGAESSVVFMFSLELIYFYIILFSFKRAEDF